MSRFQHTQVVPSSLGLYRQVSDACHRFEKAWQVGQPLPIEDFLPSVEEEVRLLMLEELVLLEMDYRRRHGEVPELIDYFARFPELRASRLTPPSEALSLITLTKDGSVAVTHRSMPRVLGDYQLLDELGHGGMGTVYRAEHRRMKRLVAVKVLHPAQARNPIWLSRFQREVETLGRLHHPNVVRAFDAGEVDGNVFLVTELIHGHDLGYLVKERGAFSLEEALACTIQAAEGLAYAHRQGVVHRDVKPSNLIRDHEDNIRLLDLGLARIADEGPALLSSTSAGLTGEGTLMGTLDFMAPEQAVDPRKADERSDIYSLGCTLYFLLTGRSPYLGSTLETRKRAHQREPIPSLLGVCSDIPASLDQLFRRMLAKSPDDRPESMEDVLRELRAVQTASKGPTRRAVAGLISSVLAVGVGTACWTWWRTGDDKPTPRPRLAHLPLRDARAYQRQWADYLKVPVQTTNVFGMEMVLIPPGKFLMGSSREEMEAALDQESDPNDRALIRSEEQRAMTISKPFYLSATPVTVGQFRRFVEAESYTTIAEKARKNWGGGWGWKRNPRGEDVDLHRSSEYTWKSLGAVALRDDFPVGNVCWLDVQRFLSWMNEKLSGCRLPTEAEWEYACRTGSTAQWCFGDDEHLLPHHAWYVTNSDEVVHPVRQKEPSAFGLFDMHGNCAEWCALPERPTASDLVPAGLLEARQRDDAQPVRGGRFNSKAWHVRSASRDWSLKGSFPGGFRVLQDVIDLPA